MTEACLATKAEARSAGHRYYFTGVACRRGHLAKRWVSSGHCIECAADHQKAWWGERGAEYKQKTWRDWCQANADRRNAYKRAKGHWPNPVKKREWVEANREKCREAGRQYYQRNKDKYRAKVRNRYARQKGAEGRHTAADIEALLTAQRHRCIYCRSKLVKCHIDHVVPLVLGGSNDKENLQILCPPCNLSKGAKDPVTFANQLGLLV